MGLFIEGLDVPEVSCCILARPTQSVTIYLQAVGRAMRPAKGKTNCIILDHAGLTHSHGLVDEEREWSLEGKKKKSRKGEQEKAPSVTVCDSCFCAYSRVLSPDACPECGKVTERKGREIEINADENLIELTPEMMQAIKQRKKDELKSARTIEQLIELGNSRGYRNPFYWAEKIISERKKFGGRHG
jgi:superfamily II DNA or RNA helicase